MPGALGQNCVAAVVLMHKNRDNLRPKKLIAVIERYLR